MDAKLTNRELDQARARVRADEQAAIDLLLDAGRKPITREELIVKIGDRGLDASSCGTRAFGYWRRYEDVTVITRSFVIDPATEPAMCEASPAIVTTGGAIIKLLPGDYITIGIGRLVVTA